MLCHIPAHTRTENQTLSGTCKVLQENQATVLEFDGI